MTAACAGHDPELWFPTAENVAVMMRSSERAKAICHRCEDRRACFEGALERHEKVGMWGGLSFSHNRWKVLEQARRAGLLDEGGGLRGGPSPTRGVGGS